MLLSSKLFSQIDFFLGGSKKVNSLEEGSKLYGGATQIGNEIYSNCEGTENIKINKKSNKIALFIPSTMDVDSAINSSEYVKRYYNLIKMYFHNNSDIIIHNAKGGWYSDDMQKVVVEDITIIEVVTDKLDEMAINYMLEMGLDVKKTMNQEAVSVTINGSLALV